MFLVQVNKNIARVTEKELVTSGSQNCYVMEFQFSSEWDYLERTVVFTRSVVDGVPPARDTVFQQYLTSENTCMIPWEIMVDPKKELFVGVYGTRDGNVVLPTVWASIGTTLMGVTTGMEMSPPTANVYEGLLGELSKIRDNLDHLVIGTMLRVFSDQNITTVDDFLNAGLPRSFTLVNTTISPAVNLRENEPILSLPFISEIVYVEDAAIEGQANYRQLRLTNMLGHTYLLAYDNVNTPHSIVRITQYKEPVTTTFFWMTATMATEPTVGEEISVSRDRFNDIPNVGDAVHGFVRNSGEEKFVKYVEGIVESVDDVSITLRLDEIDDMTPGNGPEGKPGKDGAQGEKGDDGITPHIDGETKHWFIGDTDTGVLAEGVSASEDYWFGIQYDGTILTREPNTNGYFGVQIVEDGASLNIADFPDDGIGYLFVGNGSISKDSTSYGAYLLTCKKGSHDVDFGGYLCPVVAYRKIISLPNGDDVLSPTIFFVNFDANPPERNTQYIGTPKNFVGKRPNDGITYQMKGIWFSGSELYAVAIKVTGPKNGNDEFKYIVETITKIGAESASSESYSVKAPVGTIVAWSGTIADIPTGWQLCDGTNGTPDLRGKFIFGAAKESDVGQTGGEKTHALSVDEMPSHKHSIGYVTSSGSNQGNTGNNTAPYAVSPQVNNASVPSWYYYNVPYTKYDAHVSTAGSTQPHNNMPPYFTLAYIMKMTQDETDAPFTLGDTLLLGTDDVLNVKDPVNNVVTTEEYEALTAEQKANGLWLINDPGEPSPGPDTPVTPPSTTVVDSVPTGTIVMWSGSLNDVPEGWAFCNGQNGTPDLRNKFVLCANPPIDSYSGTARPIGHTGGSETVTLTEKQIPPHTHAIVCHITSDKVGGSASIGNYPAVRGSGPVRTSVSSSSASVSAHENMPPYYALAYIMKIGQTLAGGISVEDYDVKGTSGNATEMWHVRKWSDGYLEMMLSVIRPSNVSNVLSGTSSIYYSDRYSSYAYPVELTKKYTETITALDFNYPHWMAFDGISFIDKTTPCRLYANIGSIVNSNVSLKYHVTGRWK